MDTYEIEKELRMTYEEMCKYLQSKYGIAKVDYFPNEECRARNKNVSRTNEGLFCHHIYEKFGGSNLCHPSMARQYPYEYQKRENLVYCNYLEHLLLHLKINISSDLIMNKPLDVKRFFNSDGFFWIANEMNELFKNSGSSLAWKNNCYSVIKENYENYIDVLRGIFHYLVINYCGEKRIEVKVGKKLPVDLMLPKSATIDDKQSYKTCTFYQEVIYVSHSEKRVITKMENCIKDPIMLRLDIPFAESIAFDKKDSKHIVITYELDALQKRYDFDSVLDEYKSRLSVIPSGEIWDAMLYDLNKPFDDRTVILSKYLCEGTI